MGVRLMFDNNDRVAQEAAATEDDAATGWWFPALNMASDPGGKVNAMLAEFASGGRLEESYTPAEQASNTQVIRQRANRTPSGGNSAATPTLRQRDSESPSSQQSTSPPNFPVPVQGPPGRLMEKSEING